MATPSFGSSILQKVRTHPLSGSGNIVSRAQRVAGMWRNASPRWVKQDPVAEHNSLLWNRGTESDKALARDRKRKLVFISNICIIKDPLKPENEGKVFLFRYGKKIY